MRTITKIINAVATSDGDGVKIKRIGGVALNALLDPFLMIDEINSDDATDYIGGFPEYLKRGQLIKLNLHSASHENYIAWNISNKGKALKALSDMLIGRVW